MQAADDDPDVRAIVLDIDSRARHAIGTPEAAAVGAAASRKPVVALTAGTIASAAQISRRDRHDRHVAGLQRDAMELLDQSTPGKTTTGEVDHE